MMLADDENVILSRDRWLLERISSARQRPDFARNETAHHLGATVGGETINRMCTSKKSWFRTQEEADKAAHDCTQKYGDVFRAYRCRACDRFHLTTRAYGVLG